MILNNNLFIKINYFCFSVCMVLNLVYVRQFRSALLFQKELLNKYDQINLKGKKSDS